LGALKQIGDFGPYASESEVKATVPRLPCDFTLLATCERDDLYQMAWEYLVRRGVTGRQITEKRIGVSLSGKYAHRIIFPFYVKKHLMGFSSRGFTQCTAKPKYLHSEGLQIPYNIPDHRKDRVILSEGIFDALAIERAMNGSMWDSGALMGHFLSEAKMEFMKTYKTFLLYPDPDKVGMQGMLKVGEELVAAGKKVLFAVPEACDAGSTPEDKLKERILTTKVLYTNSLRQQFRLQLCQSQI